MRKLSKNPVGFLLVCAAPLLVLMALVLVFSLLYAEGQLIDALYFAGTQLAVLCIPLGSGLALAYSWQNRHRLLADRQYLALLLTVGHVLLFGLSLLVISWLI